MSTEGYLSSLFSLKGKNALVTGSSGGIGTAITLGLAQAGAKVGIHGTNRENLEKTLALVEEVGGSGVIITADLRNGDEAKADEIRDSLVDEYDRIKPAASTPRAALSSAWPAATGKSRPATILLRS